MARTKQQKKEILEKLQSIITDSKSMVFVSFKGLRVNDTVAVRKGLRGNDVGFFVSKKSLTKKAFEGKSVTGTMPDLNGQIGVAYGSDLIAPAREVYSFHKKFKDNLNIEGGVFEGKFMTKEEMMSIALIPSQQGLYGMLANVINSPIQGFVVALNQIAEKKGQASTPAPQA